MRNNNDAWSAIFQELKILQQLENQSYFSITASQINKIGNREARLMAKFDTLESLPELFRKYNLNINAISNGNYIIFKDEENKSFIKLPDYKLIVPIKHRTSLDFDLQTLNFSNNMSESNAIDYAHHSGILSDYSGEKDLKLTTRGRFYSEKFTFKLGSIANIEVKGVQIEVDAGYEGRNQFLIIEAKSSTRSTFNIRQLYYPYRHFQNRTDKKIRTILISFSNGIYYFTELQFFSDYYDYKIINNLAVEEEVGNEGKLPKIQDLLSYENYTPINIPVPQADDINKVIDVLTFLINSPSDKFGIAGFFEFDERQGDYYGNAGCYIGLLQKSNSVFIATDIGKAISLIKNRQKRNIEVIKLCLKTSLFSDILKSFINANNSINENYIINRIAQEGLTGATVYRRKSTIISWLKWIIENLEIK